MKGQKDFVVEAVEKILASYPHPFVRSQTNALDFLSDQDISTIKSAVHTGIMCGNISYSKPLEAREVSKYASSMVMHQLKHAKELNGGKGRERVVSTPAVGTESDVPAGRVSSSARQTQVTHKGIKIQELSPALAEYVRKL